MRKRLNKERILFLVSAALTAWVLLKLGLFLAHGPEHPATAKVPAPTLHTGDPDLRSTLPVPPLSRYTDAGDRVDPFQDAAVETALFVRTTITHWLDRTTAAGLYTFECRMIPRPLSEIRFRVPSGVAVDALGEHIDARREVRREGDHLVVPIEPQRLARDDYACSIRLAARGPLPSLWRVPVIACTGAMPGVRSESGHLAILVRPGTELQVVPLEDETTRRKLTLLTGAAIPRELASDHTRLVYRFRQPDYALALRIIRPRRRIEPIPPVADGGTKTKGETGKGRKDGKGGKDGRKTVTKKPRATIPGRIGGLPLRLTMVVRAEGQDPRLQAVVRHTGTGELFRGHEGDVLYDGIRIRAIRDNAVIIIDDAGRHHILYDRFPNL